MRVEIEVCGFKVAAETDYRISPCLTAQELESALHKVCDHDGRWECEVRYDFYEKAICLEVKR